MLSDGVAQFSTAGKGTHNRRPATDIRSVTNDNALRDTTFDHAGSQRSGIVIHKTRMHDGSAFAQVCTQTNTVSIADAHTGGNDVIDHTRHLVDSQHIDLRTRHTGSQAGRRFHDIKLALVEIVNGKRTIVGPYNGIELAENTIQIHGVRHHQPQAQRM